MTILTSDNFEHEVLQAKGLCVVDFWASWCGPCAMLSPVVDELAGEMTDVKFCKCNVDDERELAIEYGVESIPTLLCVRDGQTVGRLVGYRDKERLQKELMAL